VLVRLSVVLILSISLVVAAAIALSAYLNFGSVRASYLELVQSRMQALGNGLVNDIEVTLSFGIPLAGQQTLAPLLARERGADPLLESIDVVNSLGRVIFSSDEGRLGAEVSADALRNIDLSLPIINPFGSEEGSVLLRADQARIEANLDQTRGNITRDGIVILLACLAAAAVVVALVLLSARKRLSEAESIAAGHPVPGLSDALESAEETHRDIAGGLPDSGAEAPAGIAPARAH